MVTLLLKLIFFFTMITGKHSFAVLDNEKKVFQRLRTEVSVFSNEGKDNYGDYYLVGGVVACYGLVCWTSD